MNPTAKSSSRVVIIGGGIIGCATAYYLTRAGISDITIVERDEIASGASGYSAGILTPYSGSNDPGLLALSGASLELHAELAEELPEITGIDHGYDLKPYLRCGFEEPGLDAARQFLEDRLSEGLSAEWLSGDEARELCDWLSDEVVGACATSIEPTVDSRLLTQSLLKAAQISGATVRIGTAAGFSGREHHPNGVKLSDGTTIDADAIVLAMGPWTKEANDWLGYDIPIEPQKGELLYMHLPPDVIPSHTNVIPAQTPVIPSHAPVIPADAGTADPDKNKAHHSTQTPGHDAQHGRWWRHSHPPNLPNSLGRDQRGWQGLRPRAVGLRLGLHPAAGAAINRPHHQRLRDASHRLSAPHARRRQTLRRQSTRLGQPLHRIRSLVRRCSLRAAHRQSHQRPDF